MLQKLILHLHFTKSLLCDKIYNLCLWIIEEHIMLIIINALACVKAEIYRPYSGIYISPTWCGIAQA